VVVCLADQIDVGRGDLLVADAATPPRVTSDVVVDVAWMSTSAAVTDATYLVKCGSREVRARIEAFQARYDVASGRAENAPERAMVQNELGRLRLRTSAPLIVDAYRDAKGTGSLLVIDPATSETLGAGMIV
jgi:sulfate adenylyltransferase subunit 1 (EFTu-like GTPase family)